MAELDVQPKEKGAWWLWLLVILFIVFAACLFLNIGGAKHISLATTVPEGSTVDFGAPRMTDPAITDTNIRVSGNTHYTIYTLGENVLFASDQKTLQANADADLKQILAALNKHDKGTNIGVYGNADSTGTIPHNEQLGMERAAAVKEWLVANGGINTNNIFIDSYGESAPVASNTTAAGRQQNRNVEIVAFK